MKKKWIVIGVITILVVLIGINVWQSQATTNVLVETTKLKEETMTDTMMIPGTLQLDDEQYVFLEAEKGEVAEVFVAEGDTIEKGDQLIRYENKQIELEKRSNDLQIRSTSLQLENIRKQHRDIDKALEEDKDNELLQEEHDQIKLQQQMTGIELEQTQLQTEVIADSLENLIVTADVAGTVLSFNEQASIDPLTEQAIMQIGSLTDVVVEGTISEYDTLNVSVGQKAILTSDAVPDEEWTGEVTFIGDLPKDQGMLGMDQADTSVMYPITISIEDEINLKPGFKMLIEIIASEEKVNTLPIEAVEQTDDDTFVYIVSEGKAKRVEVKIGAVNTTQIEIVDGVDEKDEVILSPGNISDGMEVTVK